VTNIRDVNITMCKRIFYDMMVRFSYRYHSFQVIIEARTAQETTMMTSLSIKETVATCSRNLIYRRCVKSARFNFIDRLVPSLHDERARSCQLFDRSQQQRVFSTASTKVTRLRRQRQFQSPLKDAAKTRPPNNFTDNSSSFGKLEEPYEHREADLDAYLKKASLSPWVPVPDVVARKALDIAQAGPEDKHVDLGSGDGRVCFHALQYGVSSSVGIDVDEGILEVARERVKKRHPPPSNLSFVLADLLDESSPAWEHVQEATLITMFFVTEALVKLRPILEQKLVGRTCKIVTCGYEMPGWQSTLQEVVLGTQIHLYNWGSSPMDDDDNDEFLFLGPEILPDKPESMRKSALESQKFEGSKIIDRTGRHAIRGFNPKIFEEEEDDDEDWDAESDEDDAAAVETNQK